MHTKLLSGNLEAGDHFANMDVNEGIILKRFFIFEKYRIRTGAGGSIVVGELSARRKVAGSKPDEMNESFQFT
jgi:hypothetical protein